MAGPKVKVVMTNSAISILERRVSANWFDPSHTLPLSEIEKLVYLATRAPTAYNLQNWRFIAVRTSTQKARLHRLAHHQAKVLDAAVTFIIIGVLPNHAVLPDRLRPSVEAGIMPADMVSEWQQGARLQYADPQTARDEALRSATFGASTLIYASAALGLASGPMVGFDAHGVRCEFGLALNEVPVLLVAVGRATTGNWPQKPRRPLDEILEIV